MCAPVTLHHNEHGYVSWCGRCGFMNLAFGSMMVALTPSQVESFVRVLAHDLQYYAGKVYLKEKSFLYNTDSSHVKMVLNFTGVKNLAELLNRSLLMYQVHALIGS